MPFELHGRDEENVPIFTGAPEAGGAWLFTFAVGLAMIAVFLLAGIHSLTVQHDLLRFLAALAIDAALAGTVLIGSLWWYRVTREVPHLASLEELGLRFGLEPDRLRTHARDHGIRPRVRLNGESLYRPRDFGDAAWLLRPSPPPSAASTAMLRAVLKSDDSLTLARPVESNEQVVTPNLQTILGIRNMQQPPMDDP